MKKGAMLVLAAAFSLLVPIAAGAADPPPKSALCGVCHGDQAPSPYGGVPTIHGQPAVALENALYDFRAGIRPCRKPECGPAEYCPELDFCAIARELSDEEIAALSAWYAAQPYRAKTQDWNPALAARGEALHAAHCESCHAGGGLSPQDQATILRGQPKGYLKSAIRDFAHDRRIAVAEMDAVIRDLSDEDVAALAEFYARPVQ
jgi:sulfide dehydrogenase cytochrome subunit